ncbi:MAG: hypothetical protein R8G66_20165 [Cytophagales bacterium]|nr:hypothetical protein [Cytophagales bacterium]
MKIVKEYDRNELVFDNAISKSLRKNVVINDEEITIDFDSIIDTQFSGGNIGQDFEELKTFLKLGMYSRSPCGGFVNLYLIEGKNGGKYILFSGVNEVANSHYIVTIHKILKK